MTLGPKLCKPLLFLHRIGGRYIICVFYGIGKGAWVKHGQNLKALSSLGEDQQHLPNGMVSVICSLWWTLEDVSRAKMRAHKWKHSAYATFLHKSAHIAKLNLPPFTVYGFKVENTTLVPITSTAPRWPDNMDKCISCKCTKAQELYQNMFLQCKCSACYILYNRILETIEQLSDE